MHDEKVYRWTGAFGVAVFVLVLLEFPLWMVGNAPPFNDTVAHSQYIAKIKDIVLTRVLLDMCMYVSCMIFFAGFRHLIRRARAEYEWAATLVFGAGVVWWAVTLVADSLEGGAALDTLGGKADPTAVRALVEGALLIYNGPIAFVTPGLVLGAAGFASWATGALPRWTAWLAYVGAALCAGCIPAMYGGTLDPTRFYNAMGWGPIIVGTFPVILWILVAGILMIRKGKSVAPLTTTPA
jgi:hypothetical protein